MNLLFTVCGRAGSKGFKNKNLKVFLGKPLVYYTLDVIEQYKNKHSEDTVTICLNTDSEDLIELVQQYGKDVFVVRRAEELAGDSVAKMAVIKDCLTQSEDTLNKTFDVVVDLDITSPLRKLEYVEDAIQKKATDTNTDIVFSVTEARRNPYFNMVKQDANGYITKVIESPFTARQQAPAMFDMNASIYAYSPQFLKNNTSNMLFDGVCDIIHMPDTGILDIDSEEDFILMEKIGEFFL